jgi:hypothetical protein
VSEATPLWLKGVLKAERLVGSRVESAVHSGTYFDLVTQARRSTRRATRTVEEVSRRVLHLANLPAGTDIRRVREQLSRMERRLADLAKELDEHAAQRQLILEAARPVADSVPAPHGRDPRAQYPKLG